VWVVVCQHNGMRCVSGGMAYHPSCAMPWIMYVYMYMYMNMKMLGWKNGGQKDVNVSD
jgi:hypothetical protein